MGSKIDMRGMVCLVTGASRGIGKGIALQLAKAGAFVYITGRTLYSKDGTIGSLGETAEEIKSHGGKCCPIQCDHSKEEDVRKVFDKIERDHEGQLDVLVNNAFSAVDDITKNLEVPYWEQPMTMWDSVNNVGLRNHYICSVYASKLMVVRKTGLIVNISSAGGLRYVLNVPYGIGKEACDRMAADCAHELRKHNVCFVSLWPGPVETEYVQGKILPAIEEGSTSLKIDMFAPENIETPEFSGIAVCHMATDVNRMKKSGRIFFTADLAREYGFRDVNGKSPLSYRSVKYLLRNWRISCIVPRCMNIPFWMLSLSTSKF